MAPTLADLTSRQQDLLTRMGNALENLRKRGKAALTQGNVESRIQLVDDYWKKFQAIHEQILMLGDDVASKSPYMQNDLYGQAEEVYATQKGVLLDLLHELQYKVSDPAVRMDTRPRVSLPRINLPQFSGKYEDWTAFRDLFTSMIVDETTLSDVERLHYLKTSLTGEAAGLLRNLSTTNANFSHAWKVLQSRYENRRLLVGAQIGALSTIRPMAGESAAELKRVLDRTNDAVAALEALACPITNGTHWLVHLTSNRLDQRSRRDWETSLSDQTQPPQFEELKAFMENRIRALESIAQSKTSSSLSAASTSTTSPVKSARTHTVAVERSSGRCGVCQRDHYTLFCSTYQARTPHQRRALLESAGLCSNCLGKHAVRECRSAKTCQRCSAKHHTSIHEACVAEASTSPPSTVKRSSVSAASPVTSFSSPPSTAPTTSHWAQTSRSAATAVLLATARVIVLGTDGATSEVRALVDPCSEVSLISEALVQRLRLPRQSASLPVLGVGSKSATTTRGRVSCVVTSRQCDNQRLEVHPFVLPRLTAYRPRCSTPSPNWEHLDGILLADPRYGSSEAIELLLGADVYPLLLLSGLRKGPPNTPAAQETIFGWILSGVVSPVASDDGGVTSHQCSVDLALSQQVQRFWEQEEASSSSPVLTADERFCEAHYLATHSRQPDGRYIVRLPLKLSPAGLGESRTTAVRTLRSMERRFARDASFASLYRQFLSEYEALGHMVPCQDTSTGSVPIVYLPHHGVLKDGDRIRVVFNGSALTSTGLSLNAIQHVGPRLLPDLSELLLRWRVHAVAFVADIEKMYRQIRVHPDDWDLQRIVWRMDGDGEVRDYHLTTVTYGQACAPFLALRTLQQLSHDEETRFPLGSRTLRHDVYVDDVLSGAPTVDEARRKAVELSDLCMAGGFRLRKWASNSPSALSSVSGGLMDTLHLEWPDLGGRSVLGLEWRPSTDDIVYRVQPLLNSSVITKRRALSYAARLFDPLGWLAPVTIRAKIFLQSLWLLKIGWDDQLPDHETSIWVAFQNDLANIGKVVVPRWLGLQPGTTAELWGFSDASERAYGAAVYLRCQTGVAETTVRLVAAKTRVAPIKPVALPRLELCGAVLLVRLVNHVRTTLCLPDAPVRLFTDSTVVLGWIRGHPSRWKTYVANRVSEIQTREPEATWSHVSSGDNPADYASRGVPVSRLLDHSLWWTGPPWIALGCSASTSLAEINLEPVDSFPDERCVVHVTTSAREPETSLLLRFSSLHRLLRVTAWCLRWADCRGAPSPVDSSKTQVRGFLRTMELLRARVRWICLVQGCHFAAELKAISAGAPLPSRSSLLHLSPFLDGDGMLRVGGRLKHAILSFDELHPIILPRESHLTVLIIDAVHRHTLHGGVQLTLATLRRTYWILQGRRAVKTAIHRCLTCIRWRAATPDQLMAPLPAPRVRPSRPFLHTGVDYAGPIFLRTAPGRGHRALKGYVSIFVCLAVRAVHIEVVSAYSTEAFLAAYRRFAARRGVAAVLYSDCGTSFTGADAELRSLFKATSSSAKELAALLANDGTEWRFNPPAAPHFGGLWEAAVRSTKHHLRRVIGDSTLTFEEMTTFLAQVEACLNSRPLQPLSDDPDDLSALTPAHFLVGTALTTVPEPSLEDIALPRLSRWQLTQQMLQSFWRRWSCEYLSTVQGRTKWTRVRPDLRVGDMCLLRQDPLPPSKWPLARVTGVHPGEDGHVRVVTLRTATSASLTRPIAKVVPLFKDDN